MNCRMSDISAAAFLELLDGRRGHFRLESGHHRDLWLDLDPLFAEPSRIESVPSLPRSPPHFDHKTEIATEAQSHGEEGRSESIRNANEFLPSWFSSFSVSLRLCG